MNFSWENIDGFLLLDSQQSTACGGLEDHRDQFQDVPCQFSRVMDAFMMAGDTEMTRVDQFFGRSLLKAG